MDVDKCQHLCKIDSTHYPREVESFEMISQELRKSFRGVLKVTIFAATKEHQKSFGGFLLEKIFPATESKEINRVQCSREKGITISGGVSIFNLQ